VNQEGRVVCFFFFNQKSVVSLRKESKTQMSLYALKGAGR